MPSLSIASPNQIAATSGRVPRISLASAIRDAMPQFYAARQFEQQQTGLDIAGREADIAGEGIDLQGKSIDLQGKALDLAEQQQASAQRQQSTGQLI